MPTAVITGWLDKSFKIYIEKLKKVDHLRLFFISKSPNLGNIEIVRF